MDIHEGDIIRFTCGAYQGRVGAVLRVDEDGNLSVDYGGKAPLALDPDCVDERLASTDGYWM